MKGEGDFRFLILLIFFLAALVVGWASTSGSKSQWVRLLDIFAYGPFLVYIASDPEITRHLPIQILLVLLGGTTITYNLRNYLKYKQR